jgi:hypothetical protein
MPMPQPEDAAPPAASPQPADVSRLEVSFLKSVFAELTGLSGRAAEGPAVGGRVALGRASGGK